MNPENHILISDNGIKHLLPANDIIHIEAVRVYSIFYMRSSGAPVKQYITSQNIGSVVKQLDPEQFMRVHRSHIINLNEIKALQLNRGGHITLSDNTVISLAQRRKTELLRQLHHLNKKAKLQPINVKIDPRVTVRSSKK